MRGMLFRRDARALIALLAGVMAGFGLALAHVTDPSTVLGFLDVAGSWDPSLAYMLAGAASVAMPGVHLVRRQATPWLDDKFHWPIKVCSDRRLLFSAALIGIGWGMAGYGPGPAIAALGFDNPESWWFVPAMLLGMGLGRWRSLRASASRP